MKVTNNTKPSKIGPFKSGQKAFSREEKIYH